MVATNDILSFQNLWPIKVLELMQMVHTGPNV